MGDKIYLGRGGPGLKYGEGEAIYLKKHSWACGWYWGFGYLGNKDLHFHFDSVFGSQETFNVDNVFEVTWITQDMWWILRDLFKSAYALREAAEVYRHGGHQTSKAKPYRVTSPDMAKYINADLEKTLDNIWMLLKTWKSED